MQEPLITPADTALLKLSMEDCGGACSDDIAEGLAEPRPEEAPGAVAELNDAEAGNLAFILSDRISRTETLRMMNEEPEGGIDMAELSARVAKRLNELSLRLGGNED